MTDALNYARVAGLIGMWQSGSCWIDDADHGSESVLARDLTEYLALPDQMVRILALTGLPGHAWLLERHGGEEAEWVACRVEDVEDEDGHIDEDYHNPAGGGTVGEAVARCAAGLV